MIKSMALIAAVLGIIPFLLGLLFTRFVEEEKNNPLFHMVSGYMIMFGLFEIIALPLSWQRQSLSLLIGIYGVLLLLLSIISLIWNLRRLPEILRRAICSIKNFTFCIWAQIGVIAGQVLIYSRYQYVNTDDSFGVTAAATALSTNTISAYSPYTGALYEHLPPKYVLSPFHAFTAVISKLTDTHPAILAHSVFMILFLLLAYAVYALIGRALFFYDMEKTGCFLILVSALNIFAGYSEQTGGLFLLSRLWQGKAILAGILFPMILYLGMRIFMMKGKPADWLLLSVVLCACCMASWTGILLGAVMVGILGILSAWRQKSIRVLLHSALCCLPNLFCMVMYLVI